MLAVSIWRMLLTFCVTLVYALKVSAQVSASATLTTPPITTGSPTITTSTSSATAPDVFLNVPTLSVGRIELDVEDLSADINLNANVAQLVSINAGVKVGIKKVNLTITDVDAKLELTVRLGHLVDIVNRVFQSLDLNPLLIDTLNSTSSLADNVVDQANDVLGSVTQGGTTVGFTVDNQGNIVQQVNGASTIVGNYLQNMTYTGTSQSLGSGLTEKTYSYSPLNALIDIVFNTAGQVVQATVQTASGSTSTSTSPAASSTAVANSNLPSGTSEVRNAVYSMSTLRAMPNNASPNSKYVGDGCYYPGEASVLWLWEHADASDYSWSLQFAMPMDIAMTHAVSKDHKYRYRLFKRAVELLF